MVLLFNKIAILIKHMKPLHGRIWQNHDTFGQTPLMSLVVSKLRCRGQLYSGADVCFGSLSESSGTSAPQSSGVHVGYVGYNSFTGFGSKHPALLRESQIGNQKRESDICQ